ncbi:MAG: TPM domain-containing protein [Cyanobacteria bacterium P01_D01_bin.73]
MSSLFSPVSIQGVLRLLCQTFGKGLRLAMVLGLIGFSVFAADIKPAIATGVYNMPPVDPSVHVYDEAKLFSRLTKGQLEKKLQAIATDPAANSTNVNYVTLRRLDYGETIETFTEKLFSTWFPNEIAQANQILIALDAVTSVSAIQVGSEVPDVLTEDLADSIAQESLLIPIREGNYNEAFLSTSDRLGKILAGAPDPGAPEVESTVSVASTFTSAEDTDQGSATIVVIVLLTLATAIPMITYFAYAR